MVKYYTRETGADLLSGPPDAEFHNAARKFMKGLFPQSRLTCLLRRVADRWFLPEHVVTNADSVLKEVFARLESDYAWALTNGWQTVAALTYTKSPTSSLSFQLKFRSCPDHGWVILDQLVFKRWDGRYEIHRYAGDDDD